MKSLEIIWESKAIVQFAKAIEYIHNDSSQNALRVRNDIEEVIHSLQKHPERFPPDKYKKENKKDEYRAFEKHHLRITYRFLENTIRIVRVRHTSRSPQSY